MTGARAGDSRDAHQVDALITDRYLESILAAHGRGSDSVPIRLDQRPAMPVRLAAARLLSDLPRLHPSFRFEQALAEKLLDAAARMRSPHVTSGAPVALPFPHREPLTAAGTFDEPEVVTRREWLDGRLDVSRPVLVGGAITSAAISLAGAAYLAWRIRHPQSSAMSRAVRAVARARLA